MEVVCDVLEVRLTNDRFPQLVAKLVGSAPLPAVGMLRPL